MFEWTAYRLGERFRALAQGAEGAVCGARVHSVFHHAVNIEAAGSLYTLLAADIAGRRCANVMRDFNPRKVPLKAGQACRFVEGDLLIGSLRINLRRAKTWQPRLVPDWRRVPPRATVNFYLQLLKRCAPEAGMHAHVDARLPDGLGAVDTAPDAVRALIGLGAGLTPAGDDMVTGALAVANHLLDDMNLATTLGTAVGERRCKTTDVSRQMLEDALRGEYHEALDGLIYALAIDQRDDIEAKLRQLLSIGATSGGDTAAGIAAVFRVQGSCRNSGIGSLPMRRPTLQSMANPFDSRLKAC
jgi:hypothetical protein